MKRFLFYLSMLFIPFFILLILEGGLRLIGYGNDFSLLLRQGAYYTLNPRYPAKFFSQNDIAVPEFIPQKIPVAKAKNEIRIVCLGGSTTEGFPFEVDINFPRFLHCYLQKHRPEKRWRVINLGLSAINSHSVRNMSKAVLPLQPDIVLIYMGHNEFYGSLGLASNSVISSNPAFVQFYLWLKEWRLYQLLENLIHGLHRPSAKHPSTLMAAMIKKSRILPQSPIYQKTLRNFKENLKAIIHTFATHNISVFVSTVVSNLKDQQPLGYPPPDSSVAHYDRIKQALKYGRWKQANLLLQTAVKTDSLNPLTHYLLAEVNYRLKHYSRARRQFVLARDLDQIPFRAPSAINIIIRQTCKNTPAQLVPTQAMFSVVSPHHIPDSTLFLEHLHPNATGYQWLAFSFFSAMQHQKPPLTLDKNCAQFTNLDVAIGELKISDLVAHPPFNGRTHFRAHHFTPQLINRLAYRHVYGGLLWDAAHLQMGAYWQAHNQPAKALNEYFAVLQADSSHPSALYKIGDVFIEQGNAGKALFYYSKAEQANPKTAFIRAKLARALLLNGNEKQALNVLKALWQNSALVRQLNKAQKAGVLYLTSVALRKLGRKKEAQRLLQKLAVEFPEQIKTNASEKKQNERR